MRFSQVPFLLCIVGLSACSSKIEQPVASRPLVENVVERELAPLPESVWDVFETGPSHHEVTIGKYKLLIMEHYASASNKLCRRFEVLQLDDDGSSELRVACRRHDQSTWYLSSTAVASQSYQLKL